MDEEQRISELERKLSELEQRVQHDEALLNQRESGSPWQTVDPMWNADGMDDVRALVRAGKLIDAIKLYREKKNCGLKEAKDAIDAMRGHM